MLKRNILIIFGGKSGEHEVSVRSAKSVEQAIDREQFNTVVVGITHDGRWHYGSSIAEITDGVKVLPPSQQVCLPSESNQTALALKTPTGLEPVKCDVIFPVLHGPNGEDGTIQGLLEMTNLPYVGSGVLGSAVAMDKVIQKQLCAFHQLPQTDFEWFTQTEWDQDKSEVLAKLRRLPLPVFVKPVNLGSSVGVTKVKSTDELEAAIETALKYDQKVLVEKGVENVLEVEVGVLGNEQPTASVCGSLKPRTEFYDYETKYVTDDVELNIPAQIPPEVAKQIQATAIKAFQVLNCWGLSRVDFFYQPDTQQFFLNELNTMPGFTSISMYPKLWEASGVPYSELITKLIDLATDRWENRQHLQYTYQ